MAITSKILLTLGANVDNISIFQDSDLYSTALVTGLHPEDFPPITGYTLTGINDSSTVLKIQSVNAPFCTNAEFFKIGASGKFMLSASGATATGTNSFINVSKDYGETFQKWLIGAPILSNVEAFSVSYSKASVITASGEFGAIASYNGNSTLKLYLLDNYFTTHRIISMPTNPLGWMASDVVMSSDGTIIAVSGFSPSNTTTGAIYLSKNSGGSFTTVGTSYHVTNVAMSNDGTNISAVGWAPTGTNIVFVSNTTGDSWVSRSAAIGEGIGIDMSSDGRIQVAIGTTGVAVSRDYGVSWTVIVSLAASSTSAGVGCSISSNGKLAFFHNGNFLYKVAISDLSVTVTQPTVPFSGIIYDIDTDSDGSTVIMSNGLQTFVSKNAGVGWNQKITGLAMAVSINKL